MQLLCFKCVTYLLDVLLVLALVDGLALAAGTALLLLELLDVRQLQE